MGWYDITPGSDMSGIREPMLELLSRHATHAEIDISFHISAPGSIGSTFLHDAWTHTGDEEVYVGSTPVMAQVYEYERVGRFTNLFHSKGVIWIDPTRLL